MDKFKKIIGKVDKFNIKEPVFLKHRLEIALQNYNILLFVLPFAMIGCFIAALIDGNIISLEESGFTLLLSSIISLIIFSLIIIFKKNFKQNNNLVLLLYYTEAVNLLITTVLCGVVFDSSIPASSFFIVLMCVPVFILDTYLRGALYTIIAVLTMIIVSYFYSSGVIQNYNIFSSVLFGVVALAMPIMVSRSRLVNMLQKANIQKERDLDFVTGLASRRGLYKELEDANLEKRSFRSLAMIDLDFFKHYNDNFGHIKGDECLKILGSLFVDLADKHNVFFARYGGEEFIVLSENFDYAEMKNFASLIAQEVYKLSITASYSPFGQITVSVGVADCEICRANSMENMISFADKALYRAKDLGRNRVVGFVDSFSEVLVNKKEEILIEKKDILIICDESEAKDYSILKDNYNIFFKTQNNIQYSAIQESIYNLRAIIVSKNYSTNGSNSKNIINSIRSIQQIEHLPIVIASYSADNKYESEMLTYGVNDFIYLPIDLIEFEKKLANLQDSFSYAYIRANAEKDPLTGLYNRKSFFHKASLMLSRNADTKYMIMVLDIEKFKLINDYFGIKYGDRILCFIGNELNHFASINCGICSRISSDNFAALLPCSNGTFEQEFAKKLHKEIKSFHSNTQVFIKFGIYHIESINIEVSTMCDRAFTALEKTKGKYNQNLAYYDDNLRKEMYETHNMIDCMQGAIENDEFLVHYQPKFSLIDNTIIGGEALSRWNSPVLGNIMPSQFIPLFEKTGFISTFDTYVWKKVVVQIREWLDEGLNVPPISVNVSRVDFYNIDIVNFFKDLLATHNVDASYLHLEITETSYTQNPAQLVAVVKELREMGLVIEMDDFGSGYSSLNMLCEVPFDVLKLDIKFLRDYEKSSYKAGNILNFVIGLAKWINVPIFAEGIETKNQVEFLKSMGCCSGQGYYFAEAMKKSEFENLLRIGKITLPEYNEVEHSFSDLRNIWKVDSLFNEWFNKFPMPLSVVDVSVNAMALIKGNDAFFEFVGVSRNIIMPIANNILEVVSSDTVEVLLTEVNKGLKTKSIIIKHISFIEIETGKEKQARAVISKIDEVNGRYVCMLSLEEDKLKIDEVVEI